MAKRVRRLWYHLGWVPVVFLLFTFGISVAITDLGRVMSSPANLPEPADLMASLGGGSMTTRVAKSLELYQAGLVPRIFLTGPVDQRVAFLAQRGVPATAILTDGKSRHSWDEAVNTYRLMQANGWKRVLVVSDPPHMRRLAWTWEEVFVGSGLSFRLIPASLPGWDADHWWRQPASAAYVKSELFKLVYYLFRYGSHTEQFDLPAVHALGTPLSGIHQ